MTTIDAVYQNGVFRPASAPDLPEGTAVRIVVVAEPPVAAPSPGKAAYEMLRAIAEMPEESGGGPNVTSQNVDRILYGSSSGAR